MQIIERHPRANGFNAYYKTEIAPWLAEHESSRQRAATRVKILTTITLILVAAIIAAGLLKTGFGPWSEIKDGLGGYIGVAIFTLAIGLFAAFWGTGRLKSEIKSFLLDKISAFFSISYSAKAENFPFHEFKSYLPRYDTKRLEDEFSGTHEGVEFQFSEAKLKQRRGSGENRSHVVVYHGLLYHFTFSKPFQGYTSVCPNSGPEWLTTPLWKSGNKQEVEKVRLEDPGFEEVFDVYSSDQVEARCLLTPSFMERITALSRKTDTKSLGRLKIIFKENHMLVFIKAYKDMFEAGSIFSSLNNTDHIQALLDETGIVFDIIDTLQINLKTRT